MEIYDIKVNGLYNPIGFFYDTLTVSWKVKKQNGKKQVYAKIEVSLDKEFKSIMYIKEGKELNSISESLLIELSSYTRYYFRIFVTTDAGESVVSDTCFFETAKGKEEWIGKWIGISKEDKFHPEFNREFEAKDTMIESARLYICGLGVFEAYVNGKKAGNDFLAPFINDYNEHVQYCTYDITESIKKQNQIRIWLGNGWYKGRFGFFKNSEKEFALIAEIRIKYVDGSIETIGTDSTWMYRGSIFEFTDIYDGETQNYLLWEENENPWKTAAQIEAPESLIERYSPPVHEMESIPVKDVIHTPAGEVVLDMGQNFAGYIEYCDNIPYGKKMVLEFGEILQDGNFYNGNYRSAKSKFCYISDGKKRTIRTHFTFFGFRYVKISGVENIDCKRFTGKAVYTEMERTGYIETSNKKINQLYENTVWGLKSNFLDMPTDCPQRDERLGWTGDAQVFCKTAGYHMDTRAFYQKFLRDLRSDQIRNKGKVAIYLPNTFPGITSSAWSDIATFMPHMLYEYYGNKEFLKANYLLMKDWVDSIRKDDEKRGSRYLYDFGFQFGDWLALDGATEQSNYGRTDSYFIASMYYYASTQYVADAAKILGCEEDEKEYRNLAYKIREAILDEYFSPNGRLTIDTQTGYMVALKFGVYRQKARVIEGLKNRIKKDCYRIKGGFVGATMMNTVLAENGLSELAYDFLFFEGYPGWLYAINLGATTIWERWNSVLPSGKISGTAMNSLNHYSYGSVVEFLYRHAAGIIPDEPGFRRIRLEPKLDSRLKYFNCTYESVTGRYVSNWKINLDGTLSFHFDIPFGGSAIVVLPDSGIEEFELGAGSYDYTYHPKKDYLLLFSENTRLELLAKNEQARNLLEKYLPQVFNKLKNSDLEEMSKSLEEMKNEAKLVGFQTENYEKAIENIKLISGGTK